MTPQKLNIVKFLELSEQLPVIDVRSPSEFMTGHIPGARNIPLFNDEERAIVGTIYKKAGRTPAILEGLKLTGPSMEKKLKEALNIATREKLLVHCWRGGMRSETMAWLFSLAGMDVHILDGGYKSYRHYILDKLSEKKKIIILGGLTGSSKTQIIDHLKSLDQQVVDLEGLANHKGSAFGALGQLPQPSTEQFANILYDKWKKINPDIPVWLEDESKNIGTVFLPDTFYENMQKAPAIILMMDAKTRLPRLIREYSGFPKEELIASVLKISRRLGGDNTKEAISAIEAEDFQKAIEITLTYYDKTYLFGLNRKSSDNIIYVKTETDDIEENSAKVLEAAGKIR